MVVPLGRELSRRELPVLEAHGLTMWGYVVLRHLRTDPMRSQTALAAAIGADKSRLIAVLDRLEADGLIERIRDPEDRRARLLAITAHGRSIRDAARRDIRAGEERLLSGFAASDRAAFLRVLTELDLGLGRSPGASDG